jgi:glycosyltransferase involved in cell wall biosynthesis
MTSATLPAGGISVVVPVYNGEAGLPELVDRLEAVLTELEPSHEIVLVDDGSRDESWSVIGRLAAGHEAVRAIRLSRNYGQESAVLAGVRAARYAVTVTMDDDLQDRPEEIPALVAALTGKVDAVYGVPKSGAHSAGRRLATRLAKAVVRRATGERSAAGDASSTFRAFRTSLRDASAAYVGPFASVDVFLTWGTSRFASVTVQRDRRRYGKSNYTLRMLVAFTFDLLTGFTTLPLAVVSAIGFIMTLFGGVILLYVLIDYAVHHGSVPGFSFLASIIAIFSSAQLFAIGVFAQYLARMHFQLMRRPTYVIAEHLGDDRD